MKNLGKVQSLFSRLEDALKSLEEGWLSPSLRADVEPLLPEVDRIYGVLLEHELRLVKSLPESAVLAKDSLDTIAKEPHLAARKRLESRLGAALGSTGSIGKWGEKLVVVEIKEKSSAIKGYEKLSGETARFQDWISSRMSRPSKSFCSRCGWALKPGQKFCNNCGSKL